MNLKERLLKNSTIKETNVLSESKVFEKKDLITTSVPALNIALTGEIDGGLPPGVLQIAGKSRRFKSKFALKLGEAFAQKYEEGVILFYDNEFGTPESYFDDFNTDNIIHTPIVNIEQLKHDMMVQLKDLTEKDRILIIIDSIGNIASIKEIEDAESGKQVTDMTRAKAMKSLFRMITPLLTMKNIPLIIINHTYDTQEMYSKEVTSGGNGPLYNSNIIWVISREQNKDAAKELLGYDFKIKIDKSRFVREASMIPITVSFDEGIAKWSGMFDLAEEAGYIVKVTAQKYARKGQPPEEGFKRKDVENSDEFWEALFKETDFKDWIKKNFQY